MAEVRAYILSVTAAGLLCGMANAMAGKFGPVATVLRLITGIVMACVIVQPFGILLTGNLENYIRDLDIQTTAAVQAGTDLAQNALCDRIKSETQAYILDMAAELNADISVEVVLNEDRIPVPVAVILEGDLSPSARQAISAQIRDILGIGEEAQQWR